MPEISGDQMGVTADGCAEPEINLVYLATSSHAACHLISTGYLVCKIHSGSQKVRFRCLLFTVGAVDDGQKRGGGQMCEWLLQKGLGPCAQVSDPLCHR